MGRLDLVGADGRRFQEKLLEVDQAKEASSDLLLHYHKPTVGGACGLQRKLPSLRDPGVGWIVRSLAPSPSQHPGVYSETGE